MKKFFWLMTGVAAGLVIAKQIESNPRAQAVVDDATAKAKEFGAAIAEGFKEREAELAIPVATTKVSATTKGATQTPKRAAPSSKAAAKVTKTQPAEKSASAKATAAKKTTKSE